MAVNSALLLQIAPHKIFWFLYKEMLSFFFLTKGSIFLWNTLPFLHLCFLTRVAQAVSPVIGSKPIPILASSVIAHSHLFEAAL